MNADEIRVKKLLQDRKCEVERIQCNSKNTDFKVKRENLEFFCEVKAIKGNSVFNAISSKIHEAIKQFKSVNPGHTKPNVLFFCNYHESEWINSLDLMAVLTGNFYSDK